MPEKGSRNAQPVRCSSACRCRKGVEGGKALIAMEKRERASLRRFLSRIMLPGILLATAFFAGFGIRAASYCFPAADFPELSFFTDENGDPYLIENDSYYYLRKAREMAERGTVHPAENREEDPLIGARMGGGKDGAVQPLGLSVLAWALWRLLSPFGVSLTRTAAWMGPVIGSLAVLPAYFYTRRRTSLAGGLTAALLAAGSIPFVLHTRAGFFDTDMVLAVLPLTALPAQFACLCAERRGCRLAYGLVSAAAFAVTALFWRGWYAYLLFSDTALLVCTLLMLLPFSFPGLPFSGRLRRVLRGLLPCLLLPLLMILLVRGWDGIREILNAPAALRTAAVSTDAMPYAQKTIVEMQPLRFLPAGGLRRLLSPDTDSVLGRMGGLVPFSLALLYFPLQCAQAFRARHRGDGIPAGESGFFPAEPVYFALWLAAGILLARRASRFAEVAALPVCLLCGLTVGGLFRTARRLGGRRRTAAALLCAGLAAAAAVPTACTMWNALRTSVNPTLINDGKQAAMRYIRENTPENTVAASWWDDGYYMQYEGRRRTLGDGGSDSGARSWFLAKALLAEDPRLTAGIFRMLGESGTEMLDRLTETGMDQARAAGLLLRILPLSRQEAEEVFRAENLPPAWLENTHPADPDPTALVLSTDLLSKYRTMGYFGFWNPETKAQEEGAFTLASTASALPENGTAVLAMTDGAYSVRIREGADGSAEAEYVFRGETLPFSRFILWENGKRVRDERRENGNLAAVVLREEGRYSAFLCSENLCDSMLVRLLVCEDESVPGFTRAGTWYADTEEPSAAQRRIGFGRRAAWATQVWQIDGTPLHESRIPDEERPGAGEKDSREKNPGDGGNR